MKTSVTFEGGRELSQALATLGPEATVAGRRALRASAKELAEAVRSNAPVGEGSAQKSYRTKVGQSVKYNYGRLKDNIRVREARARKDNTIVMQVTSGNAFWGRFLEFGTVKMGARPWFRPVFDRMHNSLVKAISKNLGTQIERAAKRLARKG
jgi:HK97 gp10 family phage protein